MRSPIHLLAPVCLLVLVGCTSEAGGPADGDESPTTTAQAATTQAATTQAALEQSLDCNSPARPPTMSAERYFAICRPVAAAVQTVYDVRVLPDEADFSAVPQWENDEDIVAQFKETRDTRNMYPVTPVPLPPDVTPAPLDYQRRLSWQYPDDGCMTRAELVVGMAQDQGLARPYKLFSFGSLVAATENTSDGYVYWAWHVVPVLRSSSGEPWVLDAALSPSRPMRWRDWLALQGTSPDIRVTVGDSYTYDSWSQYPSPNPPPDNRTTALTRQKNWFLHREWDRQLDLGRDPYARFGDSPPWYRTDTIYSITSDLSWSIMMPSCLTCRGADVLSDRCLTDCRP